MKIRKATKKDMEKLLEIGKSIKEFKVDKKENVFWSKKQLLNWVKSKKDIILIAAENKQIVGFIMFAHHVPTGKVILENVWVNQGLRRKNIAGKLIKKGLSQLKKKGAVYLCASAKINNFASIKFLEKNKFMRGFDFSWLHRKI